MTSNTLANYPHLNALEPGSLLRTECERATERIALEDELKKTTVKEIENRLSLEHELLKCTLAEKSTTEIEQKVALHQQHADRLKKLSNNFKHIDEDRRALAFLNNGLKNASDHGSLVFTTFPKALTYIIKNPGHISLANCFAHYPASIAFYSTLATESILLRNSQYFEVMLDTPELFLPLMLGLCVIPTLAAATIADAHMMSHKSAVKHILRKTPPHIQEIELEKYAQTAENLALQHQSFSKPKKTIGKRIDDSLGKLKTIIAIE